MTAGLRRSFFALLLLASASMPAAACDIVYGDDWAFASEAPKGWISACGDDAMEGTSLTLWPKDQPAADADALIYVTVNDKNPVGLQAFALDEQARFKQSAPGASVVVQAVSDAPTKYILVRYSHASGNREELVAYMEGPNVYYVFVLTAGSESVLNKDRPAFLEYLASVIPMDRK